MSPTRRLLGRPRPDVAGAIALGVLLALVTILPAIGRPDELVDSPDAVYHLNRIALFLDTGNFSIANPTSIPTGSTPGSPRACCPASPTCCPAPTSRPSCSPPSCGRSGASRSCGTRSAPPASCTYAGGLASAAFVSFPTILLGWGVLWPNLMATALTPGALALMLQAARSRRVGQWLGFAAALPGLALIQPNALVALVVFALVWFGSARVRAGLLGHLAWWKVVRDLALVAVAVVGGLLLAPVVSARLASTQSYEWKDRVSIWTALVEVVGGRLQIPSVLWGPLLLIVLGIGWIVLRARAALPVVAMWLACVVLYVMAASSTESWTALITGYWYNDKVRLASLAAVPGVVLVAAAAPALRALLTRLPPLRTRPMVAAALALALLPLTTVVLDGGTRSSLLSSFFRPDAPEKVILSFEAQESLREIAALIPEGEGVVGRPENGSPLMFALFGTNTLYRSIPIPTTGDEIVIGTGFNDMVNRPDVCAALARHDIRWAIDSSHVYWLDRPERSSGLTDLETVDGLEEVRTVGDYTLYRITACGLG